MMKSQYIDRANIMVNASIQMQEAKVSFLKKAMREWNKKYKYSVGVPGVSQIDLRSIIKNYEFCQNFKHSEAYQTRILNIVKGYLRGQPYHELERKVNRRGFPKDHESFWYDVAAELIFVETFENAETVLETSNEKVVNQLFDWRNEHPGYKEVLLYNAHPKQSSVEKYDIQKRIIENYGDYWFYIKD